jgi:hypothetical protein
VSKARVKGTWGMSGNIWDYYWLESNERYRDRVQS